MAGVKLLEEARAAGLMLRAEGDRLIIRGPKSAEKVAKTLLERKAEILPLVRQQEQPAGPLPDYQDLYHQMAEAVRNDCQLIDPYWLLDRHPELWERIVALDDELSVLERGEASLTTYQEKLSVLVQLVQEVRRLQMKERETETVQ